MDIPLLKDILLIFSLSIAVLLICYRLRVASTVGFILTGVLAGPHGLELVSGVMNVEVLAEIGVVLLLFSIGLEFSLRNLLRIKRLVLEGGSLQVLLTILAVFAICSLAGISSSRSLFFGLLISLSSTAIVLRLFQERAEIESPQGQLSVAILIFQDIAAVPMMLLLPILAGSQGQSIHSIALLAAKALGFILLVLAGAKWIVPQILALIAGTRSRELFLLSVLVICFSIAFLSHVLGLSLALGAFMAGLIISETEFRHETMGSIFPFRDAFTSLFFVSIGMLLDVGFLVQQPFKVALISLGVMALKWLLAGSVILLLRFPLRTAVLGGLAICQVGEFSFILFTRGSELGLADPLYYQLFLTTSIITMGVTPFVIALAPWLGDRVLALPFPARLKSGFERKGDLRIGKTWTNKDHLIIVGFGVNGRNLSRAARLSKIPYVIMELNLRTVQEEREKGEPIYYGDATQPQVLEHAGIRRARILVIVISDPLAIKRITSTARRENPGIFIIVRTRFLSEVGDLVRLGADEVVPEEFETSVEIFSRVLAKYMIPRDEINRLVSQIRADSYAMFRAPYQPGASLPDLKLTFPDVHICTVRLREGSPLDKRSIGEVELRKRYGVTVLAIRRGNETISNPGPETVLSSGDLLVTLGGPECFDNFFDTLSL